MRTAKSKYAFSDIAVVTLTPFGGHHVWQDRPFKSALVNPSKCGPPELEFVRERKIGELIFDVSEADKVHQGIRQEFLPTPIESD